MEKIKPIKIKLPEGLHIKAPDGVIFYLTAGNEPMTKVRLLELYDPDSMLSIQETDEEIKLRDIFET
jgi:hypothetical protein